MRWLLKALSRAWGGGPLVDGGLVVGLHTPCGALFMQTTFYFNPLEADVTERLPIGYSRFLFLQEFFRMKLPVDSATRTLRFVRTDILVAWF